MLTGRHILRLAISHPISASRRITSRIYAEFSSPAKWIRTSALNTSLEGGRRRDLHLLTHPSSKTAPLLRSQHQSFQPFHPLRLHAPHMPPQLPQDLPASVLQPANHSLTSLSQPPSQDAHLKRHRSPLLNNKPQRPRLHLSLLLMICSASTSTTPPLLPQRPHRGKTSNRTSSPCSQLQHPPLLPHNQRSASSAAWLPLHRLSRTCGDNSQVHRHLHSRRTLSRVLVRACGELHRRICGRPRRLNLLLPNSSNNLAYSTPTISGHPREVQTWPQAELIYSRLPLCMRRKTMSLEIFGAASSE